MIQTRCSVCNRPWYNIRHTLMHLCDLISIMFANLAWKLDYKCDKYNEGSYDD